MDHLQEGKFTLTVLKVCVPKVQSGEHVNFPNDFSVFMPGTFTIMLSPRTTVFTHYMVNQNTMPWSCLG